MTTPHLPTESHSFDTLIGQHPVHGLELDAQSRCLHYHTPLDIVAIRMACCDRYFACIHCHETLADHNAIPWTADSGEQRGVLCGACATELTITEYISSGSQCPHCTHPFNPGCSNHWHFYFTLQAE